MGGIYITNIKKEGYILGKSNVISINYDVEKVQLNLGLVPSLSCNYGKIYGIVKDENGFPIKDALIKIMDNNYEPLLHVVTDKDGIYLFDKVERGTNYKIFAVASGKKLEEGPIFTVCENEAKEINFKLYSDSALKLGVIAGDIIDKETFLPINNAIVFLMKRQDNENTVESITYTNRYGQYIFSEVKIGLYTIKISSLGYIDKYIDICISECGEILPMKVELQLNPQLNFGTVSGVIMDNNDKPIERADVILYKIENNSNLIPISFTKTNKKGVYLFMNVPKGNYKIKANEIEYLNTTVIDLCNKHINGCN